MRSFRNEDGFTLLETLIAVGIFAIGSLGVLGLVTVAIGLNGQSRQFTEAGLLAQWKLDQLSVLPSTDANVSGCSADTSVALMCRANGTAKVSGSTAATVNLADIGATAQTSTRFQLFWSATDVTAAGYAGIKSLGVQIRWPHDRNVQALVPTDTGFVDCAVGGSNCYSIIYRGMRKF